MNTTSNNFENRFHENQFRSRKIQIFGEGLLFIRFVISILITAVILSIIYIFNFTYIPIFILIIIQILFLVSGALVYGINLEKMRAQINDDEISKLLRASAILLFLMSGLMIIAFLTTLTIFLIPSIRITIPTIYLSCDEWIAYVLFDLQTVIELPLFSISFLLFGIAIHKGYKKNIWKTKFPISLIFLVSISLVLTLAHIMNINLFYFGTISFYIPGGETSEIWRLAISNYHTYNYQFTPLVYGLMSLITLLEVSIKSKKILKEI